MAKPVGWAHETANGWVIMNFLREGAPLSSSPTSDTSREDAPRG